MFKAAKDESSEHDEEVLAYIKAPNLPNEYRVLKQNLGEDLWNQLKTKRTPSGASLWDCLKSGVLMPDSKMGIYGCDAESYDVFNALFEPMIKQYFNLNIYHPGKNYGDLSKKENRDELDLAAVDTDNTIVSTRVRVARNLQGFAYAAKISDKDRLAVEDSIVQTTKKFDGDLAGKYVYMKDLSAEEQAKMVNDHILFHNRDEYIQKAGMFNDWPNGRGAFYNNDVFKTDESSGVAKKAMLWVNEEDHMRVICLQKGNNLLEVYSRLIRLLGFVEGNLKVAEHPKWGFLASCPTNVGTGLRASVHIRIPLTSALPSFKDLCRDMNIDIRGVHGEHSESSDGTFDISNKRRFGISEFDALTEMTKGVKNLLRIEQALKAASKK